jgi:hypothetical protein
MHINSVRAPEVLLPQQALQTAKQPAHKGFAALRPHLNIFSTLLMTLKHTAAYSWSW